MKWIQHNPTLLNKNVLWQSRFVHHYSTFKIMQHGVTVLNGNVEFVWPRPKVSCLRKTTRLSTPQSPSLEPPTLRSPDGKSHAKLPEKNLGILRPSATENIAECFWHVQFIDNRRLNVFH